MQMLPGKRGCEMPNMQGEGENIWTVGWIEQVWALWRFGNRQVWSLLRKGAHQITPDDLLVKYPASKRYSAPSGYSKKRGTS
jgi:hypothetical protein